jgi:hypothetical protein
LIDERHPNLQPITVGIEGRAITSSLCNILAIYKIIDTPGSFAYRDLSLCLVFTSLGLDVFIAATCPPLSVGCIFEHASSLTHSLTNSFGVRIAAKHCHFVERHRLLLSPCASVLLLVLYVAFVVVSHDPISLDLSYFD